jgi:2'-5' RNA ligase
MAHRTFLALDLDEAARRRLARLRGELDDGRSKIGWVSPENLHVTLKFLGDVEDALLADVCRTIQDVAAGIEAFDFDVLGVQAVPDVGNLRMFWAGVLEPTGRLEILAGELESAFAGLGFKREDRAFKPHITLARVKFTRDPRALRAVTGRSAEERFGVCRAECVTVYTSELRKEGPVYTPIAKAPLGG